MADLNAGPQVMRFANALLFLMVLMAVLMVTRAPFPHLVAWLTRERHPFQRMAEITGMHPETIRRGRDELMNELKDRPTDRVHPGEVQQDEGWIVVFGSEKEGGPLRLEWKVGRYEFHSDEL